MIHFTQTEAGVWIDDNDIRLWHTGPKEDGHNGWSRVGYADLFLLDGTIKNMIPYDDDDEVDPWEVSYGAAGWNSTCLHLCYVGGMVDGKAQDTRSPAQHSAMENHVKALLSSWPALQLIGHNQVNEHKECPGFDVRLWAFKIGIADENIDNINYANNSFII